MKKQDISLGQFVALKREELGLSQEDLAFRSSLTLEQVRSIEQGLELYRQQKWKEAFKLFDLNARKYHDYPSIVFIDRIRHFAKNPPPKDWDGVFVMKTK